MSTNQSLVLVDASSYFFRAFHALPPLANSKGQPTGAIYGVANMIKRLVKDYSPALLAVVFDAKGKTFRDEWYPQYKAHRPPMPQELSCQFQPLLKLIEAMGLPILMVEGVEADDVIGTLARLGSERGMQVVISTGDKDMAQLVTNQVTLINTMNNQILDESGVKEKFGVTPQQIIDYLTLIGDASDNIPGVTKCGPKTAQKWLSTYQNLDNLLTCIDEIRGKIGEYLRECIPHLSLSKRLVTIKTDVELPVQLDDLVIKKPHREELIALIREFEFKQWLKLLLDEASSHAELTSHAPAPYTLITDVHTFEDWLQRLRTCNFFCVKTETTHLDMFSGKLVGLSFAIAPNQPVYIPLAHLDGTPQLSCDSVLASLRPILEDKVIGKIGQDLKQDYNVFKQYGITLNGIVSDTMLESYVLNSSLGRHDMDSLALKYLGQQIIRFADVVGKGAKQRCFDEIPVLQAAPYAAEEVDVTLKLHQKLFPMLDDSLKQVLKTIEVPLLPVLADIERCGVLIDEQVLKKQGQRLKTRIAALEEEAFMLAGKRFNLNSTQQLQEILYVEQQLPILDKTPKGLPSTAESVLQELAYDYRLPAVVLEYRSLSKLVSTYIDALPKRINPQTGRVHTSYNQAVTATGRLSSTEPNLQNIPIRSEEGRLIRQAFIAADGHVILTADYSQIELRIMAHLSNDPGLLNAFANGLDIHTATASEIFEVPLDAVTSEHRRRAKAVNFGLIYGMSAFGLSKQLGVERAVAMDYIARYFRRYQGVQDYMERTRKQAHLQGYVETVFGRRLNLPDINVANMMRRKAAERMAINAPMQGTAADLIKKAMLSIAAWQKFQTTPFARMTMQVHDELVFEVKADAVESARHEIKQRMEHAAELSVPLIVSIGVGANWDEAH
jgi:DNA polymerase-1